MKTGDRLELFDSEGNVVEAEISGVAERVLCRVVKLSKRPVRSGISLTIASALPKGKRASFMVEKLCELGVDSIVPVRFARSNLRLSAGKLARLQRVALSATKQCRRAGVPAVYGESTVEEICNLKGFKGMFLADRDGELVPEDLQPHERTICVVGPEGGLTADEKHALQVSGFRTLRLGSNLLRTETAAIAGAVLVLGK